jgi:16S rRNA (adenine1518-N6/adenine1519-N6)-dimethyltransferase
MDLIPELKELAYKHGFETSNRDQRFLINPTVIAREIEFAELSGSETVLEIGTGFGFLTREIAKKAGKVVTIEKDANLQPIIEDVLREHKNVEVIYQNALEADFPDCDKIISNIPYSVSSAITQKILSQRKFSVLLVQKEFAEKMTAQPGARNYSKVSVISQFYSEPEIIQLVKSTAFRPQPKIKSVIIVCRPVERDVDDSKYLRVAKELFRQKNKKTRNILKGYEGQFANQRVRTMTVEDIISVAGGK